MSENEFVGYVIVVCLPLLGSIAALIKPIINLNVSIQKLYDLISQLNSDNAETKSAIKEHEGKIADHEARLRVMEHESQED